MRKYLLHVLIISFVFILTPACDVAKTVEEKIEIELEDYKEEVRKNPDDALAHYHLGQAYLYAYKYEKAILSYKQAIRIDPDFAAAYHNLGISYRMTSSWKSGEKALEKAVVLYKKTIRINPDDVSAHYPLGLAYLILNDRDSAIDQYKILKKLDTELANELFNKIYK